MKLSESIILGELAAKPAYRSWFRLLTDPTTVECRACAVGRTCLAAGYIPKYIGREEGTSLSEFMNTTWPWTVGVPKTMPEGIGIIPYEDIYLDGSNALEIVNNWNPILCIMSNLYENHGWSMQKIAKWVATQEAIYCQSQVSSEAQLVEVS